MNRSMTILVLLGTMALMMHCPDSADAAAPPSGQRTSTVRAMDNVDFGFDLFRQLAQESEQNLFLSPYSLSAALTMALEGARGPTALEMGRVLRLSKQAQQGGGHSISRPWNTSMLLERIARTQARLMLSENAKSKERILQTQIDALQKELRVAITKAENSGKYDDAKKTQVLAARIDALIARTRRNEVKIANAIWAEQSYPLASKYVTALGRIGTVIPSNFQGDLRSETERINHWVATQTSNRISNLIDPSSLHRDTKLVLTNAVYFQGEWAEPFQERLTSDRTFRLPDGNDIQSKIMRQTNSFGYAAFHGNGSYFDTPREVPEHNTKTQKVKTYPNGDGFQLLELPYHGDELAMVILLPRSVGGLDQIEEALTSESFAAWTAKLQRRHTTVMLPKFKMASNHHLRDSLRNMGMRRAFTDPLIRDGADFSGMTTATNSRLYISSVVHKAYVEVDEKGTEAAAASAVMMVDEAAPPVEELVPFYPEFRADRPFLFVIQDRTDNTILFLGRVNDPR